jgi:hypothetical protein
MIPHEKSTTVPKKSKLDRIKCFEAVNDLAKIRLNNLNPILWRPQKQLPLSDNCY